MATTGGSKDPAKALSSLTHLCYSPAWTQHLHCTRKVRFEPLDAISSSIVKFFFFFKLKYSHIISSLLFPPSDSSHALVFLRFIFLCNRHVSTSISTQIQPARSTSGSSYVYDSRAGQVILDNQSRGSPPEEGYFPHSQNTLWLSVAPMSDSLLMLGMFRSCLGSHTIEGLWVKLSCHICEIS